MSLRYLLSYFKDGHTTVKKLTYNVRHTRMQHDLSKIITKSCQDDQPVEFEVNPFEKEKELCILCKYDITPNYKNVRLLSQFTSSYTGRLYGRHVTRLCAHKHEQVEKEIVKAQSAGLMGYIAKERTFLEDPQIFDPEKPIRPHKY